jgi:uncharacterized protein involved in exopolysaccharide biosynthesis
MNMNTPLKVDFTPRPPRQRASPRPKRWDHRAHYADLAARTLSSIVRHRWFIVKFVAVALALACISIPLIPRKYSAEALIYPRLFSPERDKVVALANVDGAAMVAGEARLIRSDAVLRAVAMRLGHDPEAKPRTWSALALDWFRAALLPETRNLSPFDRTVALLRNKVVVMNDMRSYLISISFTASTADEAARVVNAFVTEYLRYKAKQRRLEKIDHAEVELRQQLAVYGDKHPKVVQAIAELDAERASVEAAINPQDGDQDAVANDRSVRLAVSNQTPISPKGSVILGLSFLLAMLTGIGLAVWRDRKNAEGKQMADYLSASPRART